MPAHESDCGFSGHACTGGAFAEGQGDGMITKRTGQRARTRFEGLLVEEGIAYQCSELSHSQVSDRQEMPRRKGGRGWC